MMGPHHYQNLQEDRRSRGMSWVLIGACAMLGYVYVVVHASAGAGVLNSPLGSSVRAKCGLSGRVNGRAGGGLAYQSFSLQQQHHIHPRANVPASVSRATMLPTMHSPSLGLNPSLSVSVPMMGNMQHKRGLRCSSSEADPGVSEKMQKQLEIVDQIIGMKEAIALQPYLRQNLALCDQDFWMAYMTRYDAAAEEDKERLKKLADNVMKILEFLLQERKDDEAMERIATIDRLVDEFIQAGNKEELTKVVNEKINMLTQDNNFWSRVAHRHDAATGTEEKERVATMARQVQEICKTYADRAGQSVTEANKSLQKVMTAGANEQGEWFLPLNDEELVRMRKALEEEQGGSEQLVNLAIAWMQKASENEEQEVQMVVGVIQKVLHLVSAVALSSDPELGCAKDAGTAEQLVHQILQAREERWDEILQTLNREGTVVATELLQQSDDLLQKVLFTLPAGSQKQRVMVEFIQELQTRVRKVYGVPEPTAANGGGL